MSNYGNHQHQHRTNRIGHRRHQHPDAVRPHRHTRVRFSDAVQGVVPDCYVTQESKDGTHQSSVSVGAHTRGRRTVGEPGPWGGDVAERRNRIHPRGNRFPYAAAVHFREALAGNWRHLRAQFALAGIDWRSWTAADRAAVTYMMLRRQYAGDHAALRELFELADDRDALAALARANMGQTPTIQTDR
jgi:hypothetical protein